MKKIICIVMCAAMLCSCDYVHQMMNTTVDFESVDASYLAGPTAAGENLYSTYVGNQIRSVTVNGLVFGLNGSNAQYNFYNGGVCISQFNDMAGTDYTNQCSVYYKQSNTGFGGYRGSKTFAVVYTGSAPASIYFLNSNETAKFISMQVCNTTYAYQTMKSGNAYARALSYDKQDYLKVVITGYATDGTTITGTTEAYLADFRTSSSGGIVDKWMEVDLSPLGACNKITFEIKGSDTGTYGLNTPTYFAFDDLVYHKQ
jgi:hypothetical protein